jgi:hypothetical protein
MAQHREAAPKVITYKRVRQINRASVKCESGIYAGNSVNRTDPECKAVKHRGSSASNSLSPSFPHSIPAQEILLILEQQHTLTTYQ